MVELKKNWNSFAAAAPNKSDFLQNFNYCSTPTDFFFKKKIRSPTPILKWGRHRKRSIVVCASTVYTKVEVKDTH